jgi:hypothetical protein
MLSRFFSCSSALPSTLSRSARLRPTLHALALLNRGLARSPADFAFRTCAAPRLRQKPGGFGGWACVGLTGG